MARRVAGDAGRMLALGLLVPAWIGVWAPNLVASAFALLIPRQSIVRLGDTSPRYDEARRG
jgi:hypothetical protein